MMINSVRDESSEMIMNNNDNNPIFLGKITSPRTTQKMDFGLRKMFPDKILEIFCFFVWLIVKGKKSGFLMIH